jgi:hypothetical protein
MRAIRWPISSIGLRIPTHYWTLSILLLSGRTRQLPGWRFGALLLLGNLCTEPDLAAPLILGTLLGSAVLAFTVYGGVRTRRLLRSASAPADERRAASEWPFSGDLFVLALMIDAGIWTLVFVLPRLVEAAYYAKTYMPAGDGLGILPLYVTIAFSLCGALLLLIPLTILLRALVPHASHHRPA